MVNGHDDFLRLIEFEMIHSFLTDHLFRLSRNGPHSLHYYLLYYLLLSSFFYLVFKIKLLTPSIFHCAVATKKCFCNYSVIISLYSANQSTSSKIVFISQWISTFLNRNWNVERTRRVHSITRLSTSSKVFNYFKFIQKINNRKNIKSQYMNVVLQRCIGKCIRKNIAMMEVKKC